MPEMSREELLAYVRKELNLPEIPHHLKESLPPAAPKSKSVEPSGSMIVTIAEFVREDALLRKIRLAHGIVGQYPYFETNKQTGLVSVEFDKLALWSNAAGTKIPKMVQKPHLFRTESATLSAQHETIALPPHLMGLRNAFLPYSPTQLMIAEGDREAAELLQKFVTSLSLVVPKEFRIR
jgi:hypothetical protein